MTTTTYACRMCGTNADEIIDAHGTMLPHAYCPENVPSESEIIRTPGGDPAWFVTMYRCERHHGGTEEGGWSYTTRERKDTYVCFTPDHAERLIDALLTEYAEDDGDAYYLADLRRGVPGPSDLSDSSRYE